MTSFSRQHVSRLSRDRSFLLRTSLGIMTVSCAIGWLISALTASKGMQSKLLETRGDPEKLAEVINLELDLNAEKLATKIRQADQIMLLLMMQKNQELPVDELPADPDDESTDLKSPLPMLEELIAKAEKVNASERMLLLNLAQGLYADKTRAEVALENLRQSSVMEPPVRFANEFYADVLRKTGQNDDSEALIHYRLEAGGFADAEYARQQAVRLMIANEDHDGLREIGADPQYLKHLNAHTRMKIAAILRDWTGLARAVFQFDYERSSLTRFLLSIFAGATWMIIIGQFAGFGMRRILLYVAALILGMLSASATLFAVVIHHNIRGFTLEGDLWHQLTYCVAGIGFREEAIKILFFVPLIPFLRRRPEIEALIVAGFVGLGFAIQENVGYYLGQGFTPWGRFFTANFFHLAITGILGLALVQFSRWPRTRWEELLATFIAAVVVHGLYDALILIPELSSEYSIFTLVLMALIAYRFFDQAEHLATPNRNRTLSPLGVFVIGATILGGVLMISSCWGMSFRMALISFLLSGLGVFPVVFVFVNRFRDA